MADIEFATAFARRVEKVERPRTGHESEHRILVAALGAPMQRERRRVELAAEAAAKLVVFVGAHRALRLAPKRRAIVEPPGLLAKRFDKVDRHRDRARMFTQDLLDTFRLKILGRLF